VSGTAAGLQPATLAPAQEGQWELVCALSPGDPGSSHHIAVDNRHLSGPVDLQALRQAFEDVTALHDALRLAFDTIGCDPAVHVRERIDPPVEILDLSRVSERRQRERIESLAFHESQRCFDLRTGPLWHAWVIRLGTDSYLINLVFFHVIADGWSSKVFVDDLLAAYGALTGAMPPPHADALSFAQIHAIQTRRLEPSADRVRYWRDRLVPLPGGPLFAPSARADADPRAHSTIPFSLPAATAAQLRKVAWQARTSPFVALMAGYHLLLSMMAGRDRTVISTASLGRPTERERRAILQFACDPYVSTELPESLTMLEAVRVTHDSVTTAMSNLTSYKSIAHAVNPDFDNSRPWPDCHLFDGNFYSWAFRRPATTTAGLRIQGARIRVGTPAEYAPGLIWAHLPGPARRVWVAQGGPSMEVGIPRQDGRLHYNPEIYPVELMQEFVDQYLRVVDVLAWHPGMRVGAMRSRHPRQRGVTGGRSSPGRENWRDRVVSDQRG